MAGGRRGVFISYRGVDAAFAPELLERELSRRFGRRQVFLDTRLAPGEDYVERLLAEVRSSAVLLAIIGRRWLTITDAEGRRRIDDPGDWIRRELATAFAAGIPVVPIFTDGATKPKPDDLPKDIAQLGRIQGMHLRRGESTKDIEHIAEAIRNVASPVGRGRRRTVIGAMAAVAVLISAVAVIVAVAAQRSGAQHPGPGPTSGPGTPPSSAAPTTSAAPPVTTTPSPVTTTPPVRIRWQGTVTLDAEGFATGVLLDTVPPSPQPLGDLGLVCQLSCNPDAIGAPYGIVTWTGPGKPERQQCSDRLDAEVGQHQLDVRVGTMACLKTAGGRVAWLTFAAVPRPGQMKFEITVWERS